MIVLLRFLVVYCLLLALPYQGYAAAAMMTCLPAGAPATSAASAAADHMAMPDGPHDHAAMMAAMAHDSAADGSSSGHGGHTHNHGSAKCGGSACCVAGAPVMADMLSVPALPAVSGAVALYTDYLPAVDLAHPERPPQA